MTSNKRQRELARAKYERQQARRAHQGNRRRRNQRIVAAVVVVALILGSVAWAVLSRGEGGDATATPTTGSSLDASGLASLASSALDAAASNATALPSDGASASPSASASDSAAPTGEAAPLDCASPGTPRANDKSYSAAPTGVTATGMTLTTNCGDIVIAFDQKAPQTVASLAFLAKDGFYNDTQCHRLTTAGIYVLQCGDPAGDGTGGPGYTVPDENLPASADNNYPAGTVAMANAGPNTGGSQFFLVYQDTSLPGDYTIVGTITSGLDIVQAVAAAGTADGSPDGAPQQPVFIQSATVQS